MDSLDEFIASNPDPRELKRALAVKMTLEGYTHTQITQLLNVSSGFISKWKVTFALQGIEGLKLAHQGSQGFLSPEQRQDTIHWLETKNRWTREELENYLIEKYNVVFQSKQSYYELFKAAGISWKKSQKSNPRKDPELVAKKNRKFGKS